MFGTVQSIDLVYQPLSNRQLAWIVLVESEVSSLLRMLQIFAYQFLVCALCWVLVSVGQCDRQLYTEVSVMFPGRYRGARLAHSGDLSLHTDYRPPSQAATSTRALHHHQHQT